MNADLSHIDVLTPQYKDQAFRNNASQFMDNIVFVTHTLRLWLPDVFWVTVFGPPYVALFGKENLLSAPAYLAEEIAPDMVYVQLTEKLSDAVHHPDLLQRQRIAFKEHVAVDAFHRDDSGADFHDILSNGTGCNIFRVPEFKLQE